MEPSFLKGLTRILRHLELIAAAEAAHPHAGLVVAVDQDPDEHAVRFALGARLLVAGDYHAALEQFAELERRTPSYRDGLGCEALLLVLDLLGPDDEQVRC